MAVRSAGSITMQQVGRRLARWRRTRPYPRARIPQSIWAGAVALARQYGVYETARALPIDYGALKQRLEASKRPVGGDERSRFVELTPRSLAACDGCVIELDGPRSTVRLRLPEMELAELARLSRVIAGVDG
jgi:hypothetical protein